MRSRELLRWQRLHERRAGRWWRSPWTIAIVIGVVLHVPVISRLHAGGYESAMHLWIAIAFVAFGLAFIRVPFHLVWRSDAALLGQLPIAGGALLDVALVRCARAAAATTLACVLAVLPMASHDVEMFARYVVVAGVLGVVAAGLVPAVATWAAAAVALDPRARASGGAVLGALPGFASVVVFVLAWMAAPPYLAGTSDLAAAAPELGGLAAASALALVVTRLTCARLMGTILRDVSALDRQRLAALEIRAPTALERAVAALLGDAGLPYRKDARLMRRRYPMAFALGALAFVVLVIVALARPSDPAPWIGATLAGAAVYALALAGRLRTPPIELPRLSATLPITPEARSRAKIAWLAVWLAVFVVVPGAIALVTSA
ncbi:MAG TPA: hypothetical protein VMJ10_00545 [Kofleriaceae bacterium]|nr:hypothetical protein [Kofleriaceae bacterium]